MVCDKRDDDFSAELLLLKARMKGKPRRKVFLSTVVSLMLCEFATAQQGFLTDSRADSSKPVLAPLNNDRISNPQIIEENRKRANNSLLSLECRLAGRLVASNGSDEKLDPIEALVQIDLSNRTWRKLLSPDDFSSGHLVSLNDDTFVLKEGERTNNSGAEGSEWILIDRVTGQYRYKFSGKGLGLSFIVTYSGACVKTTKSISSQKF